MGNVLQVGGTYVFFCDADLLCYLRLASVQDTRGRLYFLFKLWNFVDKINTIVKLIIYFVLCATPNCIRTERAEDASFCFQHHPMDIYTCICIHAIPNDCVSMLLYLGQRLWVMNEEHQIISILNEVCNDRMMCVGWEK